MLTKKNAKAYAVLAIAIDRMNDEWKNLFIEPYLNGREDGFAISTFAGNKVAFSENRNSDSIVVYCGKTYDFGMQGNMPYGEIYKNARYFAYNEYYEAAEWIINFLQPPAMATE